MVTPVSEEPYVELERWHFACQGDDFRLVGISAGSHRGRITSPVVEYDSVSRHAVTESGRVYRRVG